MPSLVAHVPLPGVVHDVEVAVRPSDGVQAAQRLEKGRLPGLVLANQGCDVVQGDPSRVVDAAIISDLGSSYVHYASLVLAAQYLVSSLSSILLVPGRLPRVAHPPYAPLCHHDESSL